MNISVFMPEKEESSWKAGNSHWNNIQMNKDKSVNSSYGNNLKKFEVSVGLH